MAKWWEAVGPTPLTRTNERRLTARRERHRPARRCLKLNLRQQRQKRVGVSREIFGTASLCNAMWKAYIMSAVWWAYEK